MREASLRRLNVCLPFPLLAFFGALSPALGEERDKPVIVEVDACDHYDEARVNHLLLVDLGDRLVSIPAPSVMRLEVRCQPDGVLIQAETDGGGGEAVVALESDEVQGDVGARVLTLKAVELLREAEVSEPPATKPEPETPEPVEQRRPVLRILAGGELTSFALQPPIVGAEGSVELLALQPFYARLTGGASLGTRRYGLGEVDARLISFRVEAGGRLSFHSTGFGGGLGYRFGHAKITGQAQSATLQGSSVSGLWGGPYLTLFTDTRVGPTFSFRGGAELGAVVTPVRGNVTGEDDVEISGVWAGLSLLVGATL